MFRCFTAITLLLTLASVTDAQTAALVPVRRGQPQSQSVTSATSWSLQALSPVVLSSPIVRLGDIVKPLDPSLVAWERLRRVSIGLLPTDGTAMTIQRDRLTQNITSIEATPRQIDWFGPSEIVVRYDAKATQEIVPAYQDQTSTSQEIVVQKAAFETPVKPAPPPVDRVTADRIVYWIELAIRRELRDVEESFAIQIADRDSVVEQLATASSIASIELLDEARAGRNMLRVIGRHREGPIVADVPLMLTPHPQAIVPVSHLQRGSRIGASDIRLAPVPQSRWQGSFATSPESVVGMEVRGIVRVGEPISLSEIGPPILVHRGDLIEIRVVGGGVVITTNAKSIGEGAEGELVEVETIQPRRRLIAKVVRSGLVEIFTQAPRVE